MNVFLDTNVIIDFMGEREGFFDDAATLFAMIEDGTINASTSALTIINCAYILKKAFNLDMMLSKILNYILYCYIRPHNYWWKKEKMMPLVPLFGLIV